MSLSVGAYRVIGASKPRQVGPHAHGRRPGCHQRRHHSAAARRPETIVEAATSTGSVGVTDLALVSPITGPGPVVAQMTNSLSHVRDTGGNPETATLAFFRKASGSISGRIDDVIRLGHVWLLDCEVEIGLVIGTEMPVGTQISEENRASHSARARRVPPPGPA
ncbi:hypothetical protein [Streptomyces sp. NPDC050759]|uniref:hypothetical protein n=1 Tax=Streptomyces sp. NPDC050759 TaxID=3365635 RepID=UPI0037BB78F9